MVVVVVVVVLIAMMMMMMMMMRMAVLRSVVWVAQVGLVMARIVLVPDGAALGGCPGGHGCGLV